jgi:hypothetical protein
MRTQLKILLLECLIQAPIACSPSSKLVSLPVGPKLQQKPISKNRGFHKTLANYCTRPSLTFSGWNYAHAEYACYSVLVYTFCMSCPDFEPRRLATFQRLQ